MKSNARMMQWTYANAWEDEVERSDDAEDVRERLG